MKRRYGLIALFICYMSMPMLDAHPGAFKTFEDLVIVLGVENKELEIVTTKAELAKLLATKESVVIKIGNSDGEYSKRLSDSCSSVSQEMNDIRFVSMDAQNALPFLQYLGAKLKLEKIELPCLVLINRGEIVLPIVSGFLGAPALKKLLISRLSGQAHQSK